jgi:hypothetical protein
MSIGNISCSLLAESFLSLIEYFTWSDHLDKLDEKPSMSILPISYFLEFIFIYDQIGDKGLSDLNSSNFKHRSNLAIPKEIASQ